MKHVSQKRPIQVFQAHPEGRGTGSLRSLQQQLARLEQLTQLAKPILPSTVAWQIASFEQGVLCIATEQHAAASQLRYLQLQYVERLSAIPEFAGIHRFKVIVEVQPKPRISGGEGLPPLSPESRQVLNEAASLFSDPEISEVLRRIASKT